MSKFNTALLFFNAHPVRITYFPIYEAHKLLNDRGISLMFTKSNVHVSLDKQLQATRSKKLIGLGPNQT